MWQQHFAKQRAALRPERERNCFPAETTAEDQDDN